MFFKGCQIVVVWRTCQWNLCKISLYRKWILSSERAKCVFSNFNKRTRYLGKLTRACFRLSMSQIWAKSNFELVPTVGRYLRKAAIKTEFEFEPKGSQISSCWRRVRVNKIRANEPSSTISPKSKHCSCNIRGIVSFLIKMYTKEKAEHFFG